MIELKKLTKIYQSQSKEDVVANDSISLSFSKKGLAFIVGKSGSGKTTLLNILAGLDKKTSGEYFVNNKSIDEFKSLDDFRNECVGFVFQDYNLIDYLSVAENVEIALSLQSVIDRNKVSEILSEVGLEGYENRRISELSGGQKQRVAIARALVKNSRFILADEPTGNLDSKTSKEIMKLLKQISKNKLVIVVSHNEDLAREYADRIIELADGKIASDTNQKAIKHSKNETYEKTNTKPLSYKYIAKMGFYNIKNHLGKSIISILLFALTIFSICIGQLFYGFNSEDAIIKTFPNQPFYGYLAQSISENDEAYNAVQFDEYSEINSAVYTNILDDKSSYLKGFNIYLNDNANKYIDGSFYIISSKQNMIDLDLEFYSSNEISNDGVYLTDYAIDYLTKIDDFIISNNITDYSEMKGQELLQYNSIENKYELKYKICGIIKTDYKNFVDDNFEIKTTFDEKQFNSLNTFIEYVNQKKVLEYFPIYITQEYVVANLTSLKIDFAKNSFKKLNIVTDSGNFNVDNLTIIDNMNYNYKTIVNGKIVYSNEVNLKDDEILLNLSLYNKLFNEISYSNLRSYFSYNDEGEEVCSYNFNQINKQLAFSVNQLSLDKDIFQLKDKKIVGIVVKTYDLNKNDGYEIYTNSKIVKDNSLLSKINNVVKFKTTTSSNFATIINNSRNLNIGLKSVQSESIYNIEQTSNVVSFIFIGLSIILVIIAILVSINVITLSINARKKEIGILRAIGTKKKDIEKMFIFENIVISVVSFIISMILVYLGVFLINIILSKNSMANTIFIIAKVYSWIISFCISILLSLIVCIIPLKHINKLNPIDAIKTLN